MQPSFPHLISAVVTLIFLLSWGVRSGKGVKEAGQFQSGSHQASLLLVMGTILGTIIGGAATVGTAQMAFTDGFSALWFALGCMGGCLLLGLFVGIPMRRSGAMSVPGVIRREYGEQLCILTTSLNTVGMLINIAAQMVAASALLGTLFGLPLLWSVLLSIVSMSAYVLFGGLRGTGILGNLKTILLYAALFAGSLIILRIAPQSISKLLSASQDGLGLFSRGVGIDLGAGIGAALGIMTTQTYFQAINSAKDEKTAKRAAVYSAILLPAIGLIGVQIGLYMRGLHPEILPAHAFPLFVLEHFPAPIAGVIFALLFFALLGTGSGMALGLSTSLTHDIYLSYLKDRYVSFAELSVTRTILLASLIGAGAMTLLAAQKSVLSWSFLSLGLRSMVLLGPMMGALFFKGKYTRKRMLLVSTIPFLLYVIGKFLLQLPFDPIFIGLGAMAILMSLPGPSPKA